MKTQAKITLTTLLLFSAFMIQSCGNSASLVKLTYSDNQFKSGKLCYNYAPICYEPSSVGEPYAYCTSPEATFCEIPGLNPKEWLTEEYAGSATTVLYSEEIQLPSLTELDPDQIFVCLNGDRVFSLATIEDEDAIDEIIRVFNEGEEAVWPLMNSTVLYNLKFYSEKNAPGIYYNLVYGEFEEGNFLYEQSSGRCVEIGTLIADLEV